MIQELGPAYLFHRYYAEGSRYPNSAIEAIAEARKDAMKARRAMPCTPILSRIEGKPGFVLADESEPFGFRFVSEAARGYFSDTCEDITCHGVVYQLPARNGKARYVAGYKYSGGYYGVTLDISKIFEGTAKEAADHADVLAKRAAEEARQFDAAFRAGDIWAEMKQEIEITKRNIRELLADRRKARAAGLSSYDSICRTINTAVSGALSDIRQTRAEMDELAAGQHVELYFTITPAAAQEFNEAARETVI